MSFTPVIAQRYFVSRISYTTVTSSVHRAERERIRVSLYPGEILIHFLVVHTRTLVTMFMTTDLVLCVYRECSQFLWGLRTSFYCFISATIATNTLATLKEKIRF